MRIALAQLNPVVGDIAGNTARIADAMARAEGEGAELVVFAELSVAGYPPRDLLRKERFIADGVAAVESLAGRCTRIAALVGFARPARQEAGPPLQNAAALLAGGKIAHVHVKRLLPTYDVFDETRYFQPGGKAECISIGSARVGLTICEDLWDAIALGRALYGSDPIAELKDRGAQVIINMAASPYQMGKAATREEMFRRQAARSGAAVVYVNQVGGNDELIFDGASCALSPGGELLGRARSFAEDLLIVDTSGPPGRCEEMPEPLPGLSAALKLGLRDYVRKCGFSSAVLGVSGGIDSAVVAALAADALGPDNVLALALPGRYSSQHSLTDAVALARNLGVRHRTISIEPMHAAFEAQVAEMLSAGGGEADENIQARIRGAVVMAASNALGHLPLATGNKSELSTGYCTLYGDMCGGLAPIGDVLKTTVYELAEQLNRESGGERIPRATITKPPSAELRPHQVDQDKLPPYEVLDPIVQRYVVDDMTAEQIVAEGFDAPTVHRVIRMVDAAEYKRKQAAAVLKVTARAFGAGRRMPIAQRYVPSEGE
ncbi:MAG TPA: NAD+ synthase [Phycisphaerae bacterium]|nr:NAD+ synthase [Phycisphaerae bacterium]